MVAVGTPNELQIDLVSAWACKKGLRYYKLVIFFKYNI